jgi:acetolactate synthase-1/2/3 large subunit
MKASDLFVECLENEGVEFIFAVPGEENLDLIDSVRKSSIRLIVTRHEQHAAFMAATYGRLTGMPGVCLSTLGPGATNLVTGLAFAQLGGMPLVAITGQKAVKDNWQGTFQIVDVVSTFRPLTKWNRSIVSASTIPRFVSHAFNEAAAERPGPVHIELPEDVAGEDVPDERPLPRREIRRPVADEKAVDRAAGMIRSASRPVMLISAGANRKRIGRQVVNFLEQTGIYAVSTQMGKGVLSEDHPRSLFSLGIHKRDYVNCALEDADLVITVGYNIVEFPPSVWNERKDKRIVHVDFVMAEPDVYYRPELEVVGDISNALWAIRTRIGDASFDNAHHATLRKIFDEKLHVKTCADRAPLNPQCLVHGVREVMDRDGIVCLDNGIYKIWFARQYKTYRDNTLLLDNALATMGAGLASAMAAKMVMPHRQVLAVVGDGGFMMNSQDLETAVRLGHDLVILLVRDDAYGFIRWKQAQMGLEDYGMTFGNPDFVKYAEAYGAVGLRVSEGDSLVEVLGRAFSTARERGLPVLVDCPVDYSENAKLEWDLDGEVSHVLACASETQGDER